MLSSTSKRHYSRFRKKVVKRRGSVRKAAAQA
jgi:hypothetical protein